MSFLMFAARKIQIKREMNSKNYELTLITAAANDAAKRVADAQEAQTAAKNQVSLFTSQLQGMGQNASMAQLANSGILNGKTDQQQYQAYAIALQMGSQAGNQLASAITSITDSIFSAQNKAELTRLQAQQQTLDMRKESLQTQLNSLQGEYQACADGEKQAAKSLAPQFGLA